MNRERCKELLPIIQAFAEGKDVQVMLSENEWVSLKDPQWGACDEYRIKPEPMEIWVHVFCDGSMSVPFTDKESAYHGALHDNVRHFREVTE